MRWSISSPLARLPRRSSGPASAIRSCGVDYRATLGAAGQAARLCQVPGPRRLCDHHHAAGLLPQLSAGAAQLPRARLWRDASRSASATRKSPTRMSSSAATSSGAARISAAELARHFPTPLLAKVGDEIADGTWDLRRERAAAARRSSMRRGSIIRCAGSSTTPAPTGARSSPGSCSPTTTAMSTSSSAGRSRSSATRTSPFEQARPAGRRHDRARSRRSRPIAELIASSPWHRFQMPAYHLIAQGRAGRHARQYRRRPVERQEHHRPSRGAAARIAG